MFPPGHNLQEIDWQFRHHAIPPIEDFNFTQWADELGFLSTYGGATVFPVNMMEKDIDYLLSLDDINCVNRQMCRELYVEDINKVVKKIMERRPTIYEYIELYGNDDWSVFCDNIMWLYRENLDLNPTIEFVDMEEFNTVCTSMKR